MDKDKIFNLFNEDFSNIKEKEITHPIDRDHPSFKIGMFTKLILNHQAFHTKLEKFLKKEEPSYSVESTRESSEFVVYNRAWVWLKQVDLNKKEDIFSILNFNPKILNKALDMAIPYFENREEYLKCAHIFKIQQILRERK